MKDFKKKDHQAIERIEQSGILKDVLISLEGVHETKEERIAKVDAWLSHSKNSISAFASCPYDKKSSFEKNIHWRHFLNIKQNVVTKCTEKNYSRAHTQMIFAF